MFFLIKIPLHSSNKRNWVTRDNFNLSFSGILEILLNVSFNVQKHDDVCKSYLSTNKIKGRKTEI